MSSFIKNPHARSKRIEFRYIKKKDKETFRQTFSREKFLEATAEPVEVRASKRARTAIGSKDKDPDNERAEVTTHVDEPGAKLPPRKLPSRTDPKPSPPAKRSGGTSSNRKSGIYAGLTEEAEAAATLAEDPKKYCVAAEKAMRNAVASFQATTAQAQEVDGNINALTDWEWIKDTKHYRKFKETMKELTEYKEQSAVLKACLLTDSDFGPWSASVL